MWILWAGVAAVLLIIVSVAVGLTSKKTSTAASRTPATSSTVDSPGAFASELPSDSATSAPLSFQPAEYADFTLSDGSPFSVAVGNAIGSARQGDSIITGFAVTLKTEELTPEVFSASDLTLSPVANGDSPDGGTTGSGAQVLVSDIDSVGPIACGSVPYLDDALAAVTTQIKITGCVLFDYDPGDQPTIVTYYANGTDDTTVQPVYWTVQNNVKPKAPPSGITYSVESAGGINDVTYSVTGFGQEQVTSFSSNRWSKTVSDTVDYPVLVAQNAAGGAISCTITEDGQIIAHQTSTGLYSVVTCSGS
ncbi:MAG: hypothetical protein ACJ74U_05315 [Jatrophihabitantaceae bacterium]